MNRRLFGTDGIRGTANREPISAETVLRVALAAGAEFTRGGHRHRVVIGKDTRLSGYMLEPALTAGFVAMGMDVVLLGPLPTPAIAMLTRSLKADLGVMISASHNPFQDNGIKLFGPDGYKLSDAVEAAIEARLEAAAGWTVAAPAELGRAMRLDDARGRYIEFVKSSFPKGRSLAGLKIVVDCANGAAYRVAPTVLWELGAEVIPLAVDPDGLNINRDCGAVHPASMQSQVVAHGADLGLALDGDADRLIIADETGSLLGGDQLMALVARSWAQEGRLAGGGIITTVMSNLGLERYVTGLGLSLTRTPVGDRYVVEKMRESGCNIGGEQSGHIILRDFATTGDGLLAALQVLAVLKESDRPMSALGRQFEPVPQKLENVRFASGKPLESEQVKGAIAEAEQRLNGSGRLVVRASGTEPLIRIMAEGDDEKLVNQVVKEIVGAVKKAAA